MERQRRAIALRKAGLPYDRIARELGYAGPSGAYNAVRSALKKVVLEPAQELLLLELSRLDDALAGLAPKVRAGDPRAVHAYLAVMSHRARLIGLYEPQRVDITERLRSIAEAEGLDPDEVIGEAARLIEKYNL